MGKKKTTGDHGYMTPTMTPTGGRVIGEDALNIPRGPRRAAAPTAAVPTSVPKAAMTFNTPGANAGGTMKSPVTPSSGTVAGAVSTQVASPPVKRATTANTVGAVRIREAASRAGIRNSPDYAHNFTGQAPAPPNRHGHGMSNCDYDSNKS